MAQRNMVFLRVVVPVPQAAATMDLMVLAWVAKGCRQTLPEHLFTTPRVVVVEQIPTTVHAVRLPWAAAGRQIMQTLTGLPILVAVPEARRTQFPPERVVLD